MKVLIADSSKLVATRMAAMLSAIDTVEVTEQTNNLQDTIDYIKINRPDAVILDLQMAGTFGIELVKSLHTLIPVIILLTNNVFPQYYKRFIEAGAQFLFDQSHEFDKVIGELNTSRLRHVV
ncbi:MAG: response regulator [Ignavibacteriales bacterium]|nr:response regulator [Ignavibacteriales bacterium]